MSALPEPWSDGLHEAPVIEPAPPPPFSFLAEVGLAISEPGAWKELLGSALVFGFLLGLVLLGLR